MGLTTTKSLVKCLAYSPLLAHWCGFDIMKRTLSESVFSRFEKDLTDPEWQKALSDTCTSLATQLLSVTGPDGEVVMNSTDIPARERPRKNSATGAGFGHRTAFTGKTVKRVSIMENPRMFCSPHRGSRTCKELYCRRTSIERLISVLKDHLYMDWLTKRGLDKAFTDVMVCLITFIAATMVQIKSEPLERAA